MTDMLLTVHEKLQANSVIAKYCGSRIKLYEYPETADDTKPFIVIDPLDVPIPANYASNDNHAFEYNYQIDVQTQSYEITKLLAEAIRLEMRKLGFEQLPGGLDEYFKETKRYVDARRYSAIIKNEVI